MTRMTNTERDLRLEILNSLLTTPHLFSGFGPEGRGFESLRAHPFSFSSPKEKSVSPSYRTMDTKILQRLWAYLGALFDNTALTAVERFWMHRDLNVLLDHIV